MTNFQYIFDLFSKILENSKAIQGRFHIGNTYGLQEINWDQLGDSLAEISSPKYPLTMMAPPHSTLKPPFGDNKDWEQFRIITFWCKRSFQEDIDRGTKLSNHTIYQDWHDMKRCAVNFMRTLQHVQRSLSPTPFILPNNDGLIIPFSQIGADKVSGVRYDFDFKLFLDCSLEDYREYPVNLEILLDGHEEHTLV